MKTASQRLKAVAMVLKERFPNLTVEETLDLAAKVLDALED